MTTERTLAILKPDAVSKNNIGGIIARMEAAGLRPVGMKMLHMTLEQAQAFYAVHQGRGFFNDLVNFMISGPVVVMVLEGDNAVLKYREVMGATNPKEAAAGTIRRDFAEDIDANAVHGSDSKENAQTEICYFFSDSEITPRTL